jgi:hypothetical protein
LSIEIWIPEGIQEEHTITVSNGEKKTLNAFPYKWFTVEVFNEGPDEVLAWTNATPEHKAKKLDDRESHVFGTEHKPTIWQLNLKTEKNKTATVKLNTLR